MIVWGGQPGTYIGMNTGGRYDPVTGLWTQTSILNAPDPRFGHTAVWTGSKMIVWGADTPTVNTGGRYDPATDTWSATTTTNAPTARRHHTAVWSGLQMIVWGGRNDFGAFSSGARYDPVADTWTPTSAGAGPPARREHSAVWTGTQMIVWGGRNADSPSLDTGGRYDPAIDTWTPTSASASPSARYAHTSVWTGQEMLVWGGRDNVGATATGGRYDPALDSWSPISTGTAPTARSSHAAVWTGSTMIIWGGSTGSANLNSGGRYDPVADAWSPTSVAGAPSARTGFSTAWAGNRLVVWGGQVGNALKNDGARYDPAADLWTPTSASGAPSSRTYHSAVSTGPFVIVWGGLTSTSCTPACTATDSGAIYDPSANSWSSMPSSGAPSARYQHTAVWTGDIMIVWGGVSAASGSQNMATGARYHPPSGSWAPVSIVSAPGPRSLHSAVWTGDTMVIWGGTNLGGGGSYCPGTVPVYYHDSDGDGHGDPGAAYATYSPPIGYVLNNDDCTDIDSTWWSTPSEVRNLLVPDPVTLQWSPPSNPGGVIVRYDALRSANAADFGQSASCLATNITTLTCTDAQDPGPGQVFFYLIRAENGCPHGQSPLGFDSGGAPRSGRTCP
jgi:N-acetylneuraminic acid mutarotase